MNAAVDISTTVGGAKKGKVTEYSEITGYILAEKPSMLRMIGQIPIVKNRAFDMVSNAQGFELWIPAKNRFIIGPSRGDQALAEPLENLRPQIILEALLVPRRCKPMRSRCWKQEFRRLRSQRFQEESLPSRIMCST